MLENVFGKEDISPLDDDYQYYKDLSELSPLDDDYEYYKYMYEEDE